MQSSGPIYRQIEREVFRHPINAPPFLTARVLEDGPGLKLMRDKCPEGRPFAICAYSPPSEVTADLFLWGRKEDGGFFEYSDSETRRKLISEQAAFAKEAVLAYPLEQALAFARNVGEQLVAIGVVEPLDDPRTQTSYPLFEEVHGRSTNPLPEAALGTIRNLMAAASLLSLVVVGSLAGAARERNSIARRSLAVLVIGAAVLISNAALTGALSGPHPRYQARLIWILPAILILIGGPLVKVFFATKRAIGSE